MRSNLENTTILPWFNGTSQTHEYTDQDVLESFEDADCPEATAPPIPNGTRVAHRQEHAAGTTTSEPPTYPPQNILRPNVQPQWHTRLGDTNSLPSMDFASPATSRQTSPSSCGPTPPPSPSLISPPLSARLGPHTMKPHMFHMQTLGLGYERPMPASTDYEWPGQADPPAGPSNSPQGLSNIDHNPGINPLCLSKSHSPVQTLPSGPTMYLPRIPPPRFEMQYDASGLGLQRPRPNHPLPSTPTIILPEINWQEGGLQPWTPAVVPMPKTRDKKRRASPRRTAGLSEATPSGLPTDQHKGRPQAIPGPVSAELDAARTAPASRSWSPPAVINNTAQKTSSSGRIVRYDPHDPQAVPIPSGTYLALYTDNRVVRHPQRYQCTYISPLAGGRHCSTTFKEFTYWERHLTTHHVKEEIVAYQKGLLSITKAVALKHPDAAVQPYTCCFANCPWKCNVGVRRDMAWPRHLTQEHTRRHVPSKPNDDRKPPQKKARRNASIL